MINKLRELNKNIKECDSVIIALSGGVDSAFLLYSATKALPNSNILAVTFRSKVFSEKDMIIAKEFASELRIKHLYIDMEHLKIKQIAENSTERCYICKKHMFSTLLELASKEGYNKVLEGSNFDDLNAARPGRKAAKELNIMSPLEDVCITKSEIRRYAKEAKIAVHDKPASPCYLTRFEYNTHVNVEMLNNIHKAEDIIKEHGLKVFRVRHMGNSARIEVLPEDFDKICRFKEVIDSEMFKINYNNTIIEIKDLNN